MTTRRLLSTEGIPKPIKLAFESADEPGCGEAAFWREFAARMILDALGHTGFSRSEAFQHNKIVHETRLWFRSPPPEAELYFEFAGVSFQMVREQIAKMVRKEIDSNNPFQCAYMGLKGLSPMATSMTSEHTVMMQKRTVLTLRLVPNEFAPIPFGVVRADIEELERANLIEIAIYPKTGQRCWRIHQTAMSLLPTSLRK